MESMEYRGHTIRVNDDLEFLVTGSESLDMTRQVYPSARDAKAAIDNALKLAGVKSRRKVAIPLFNTRTQEIDLIHGIHARGGDLLGVKRPNSYTSPGLYVPVVWVVELLKERHRLNARITAISSFVSKYQIDSYRGHNLNRDANEYEKALDRLEEEVAEKIKLAEETNDREPKFEA